MFSSENSLNTLPTVFLFFHFCFWPWKRQHDVLGVVRIKRAEQLIRVTGILPRVWAKLQFDYYTLIQRHLFGFWISQFELWVLVLDVFSKIKSPDEGEQKDERRGAYISRVVCFSLLILWQLCASCLFSVSSGSNWWISGDYSNVGRAAERQTLEKERKESCVV